MRSTVLVIDDDPVILRLLGLILEQSNYQVWMANSVASAWKILEQQQPHVICCDLMMPDANGLEFLARCRSTDTLAAIPVIILTGSGERNCFDEAQRLGAFAVIFKPFSKNELLAAVHSARLAVTTNPSA